MATFGVVCINACNDSWCYNDQVRGRTSTMRRRIPRVFFFFRAFLRPPQSGSGRSSPRVPFEGPGKGPRPLGRRLGAGTSLSLQRASARSSCKAGGVPAAQGSDGTGSSRKVAASALCAATEMMPLHRRTQAAWAGALNAAGVPAARARARRRTRVQMTS